MNIYKLTITLNSGDAVHMMHDSVINKVQSVSAVLTSLEPEKYFRGYQHNEESGNDIEVCVRAGAIAFFTIEQIKKAESTEV